MVRKSVNTHALFGDRFLLGDPGQLVVWATPVLEVDPLKVGPIERASLNGREWKHSATLSVGIEGVSY